MLRDRRRTSQLDLYILGSAAGNVEFKSDRQFFRFVHRRLGRLTEDRVTTLLHVTLGEANVILAGLAELPFKASARLIEKIKLQGDQQAATAREERENSRKTAMTTAGGNA